MKNFLQIVVIIFFFNSYSLSEENKIVYIDMDLLVSKSFLKSVSPKYFNNIGKLTLIFNITL